jgi:hypothetical protein
MRTWLILLAACGSSNPKPVAPAPAPAVVDCEKLLDKVSPALLPDRPLTVDERAEAIDHCRAELAKNPDEPSIRCMVDAEGKDAILACAKLGRRVRRDGPERGHGRRLPEAEVALNRLGESAKVELVTTSQYPTGTATRMPEHGCCGQPDNTCAVAPWASDPVWTALNFGEFAGHFQYTYTSDGKTFHAEAIGDLDCDGTMITYVLDGTSVEGRPVVTLTRPTNED